MDRTLLARDDYLYLLDETVLVTLDVSVTNLVYQ
jgi:hypothetical protein